MDFKVYINEIFKSYNQDWLENSNLDDSEFLLPFNQSGHYELQNYDINLLINLSILLASEEKEANPIPFKKIQALISFYQAQIDVLKTIAYIEVTPKLFLQISREDYTPIYKALQELDQLYPDASKIIPLLENKNVIEGVLFNLERTGTLSLFLEKINFIRNNVPQVYFESNYQIHQFCLKVDKINEEVAIINSKKNYIRKSYEELATLFNLDLTSLQNEAYDFNIESINATVSKFSNSQLILTVKIISLIEDQLNMKKLKQIINKSLVENIISSFHNIKDNDEFKKLFFYNNEYLNAQALYRTLNIPRHSSLDEIHQILLDFSNTVKKINDYDHVELDKFALRSLANLKSNLFEIKSILNKQLSAIENLQDTARSFSEVLGIDNFNFLKYNLKFQKNKINNIQEAIPFMRLAVAKNYNHFFNSIIGGWATSSKRLLLLEYGFTMTDIQDVISSNKVFIDWIDKYNSVFKNPKSIFLKNNLSNDDILLNIIVKEDALSTIDSLLVLLSEGSLLKKQLGPNIDYDTYKNNFKLILLLINDLKKDLDLFHKAPYLTISKKMPILDDTINRFYKTKKTDKDQLIEILIDHIKNSDFLSLAHFFQMKTVASIQDSNQAFLIKNHVRFSQDEILVQVFDIKGSAEETLSIKRGRQESLKSYNQKDTIEKSTANKDLGKQDLILRMTKNINFIKVSYHNLKGKVSSSQQKFLDDIYERTLKIDIDELPDLSQKQLSTYSNIIFGDLSKVRSMTLKANK